MKFEHLKQEVISFEKFLIRVIKYFLMATFILIVGLIPGVLGFHWIGQLSMLESLINSLSLLGAVAIPYELSDPKGLLFTAIYGLFIETIFFVSMAVLSAPLIHRFFHFCHIETK